MIKLLIFLLLIIPSVCFADGLVLGWPAAGGSGFVGNENGSVDSVATGSAIDQGFESCYSAATTGNVTYIHAKTDMETGSNAAIYSSDRTTKLGDGTMTSSSAGQINVQLDSPVSITQGTTYCLVVGSHVDDYYEMSVTNLVGNPVRIMDPFTIGDTMPASYTAGSINQEFYGLIIWADDSAT